MSLEKKQICKSLLQSICLNCQKYIDNLMWSTSIISLRWAEVYLSGELSGGGDDEGPETLIKGLAKVGQQRQTEGHSFTGACRSRCQDLPFLKQADPWNYNT